MECSGGAALLGEYIIGLKHAAYKILVDNDGRLPGARMLSENVIDPSNRSCISV
jgi:hypothetical protein